MKMAELAAALTDAGFGHVRTMLASGNVVFDSELTDASAARAEAESVLRDSFGYEAWVLVYELDEVREIAAGFPFEAEVDGHHSYVTFVSDAAVLDELAALTDDAGPNEKIALGNGVLYWQVPKSGTLNSTLGKTMGKKRYKSSTTTRNLRTLAKVLR